MPVRPRRGRRQRRRARASGTRPGVARPQRLPERGLLPAWLAHAPLVVVEPRIREEHGDHLLAASIPQADAPRCGHARAAVAAEKCGARHASDRGLLSGGRTAVLADTEMEMPRADVNGEVTVERRDGRLGGEADFVRGAFDHRAGTDLRPVLGEDLGAQTLDDVASNGDLVVLRDAAAGLMLHRP